VTAECARRDHELCQQGGCDCPCHTTIIYRMDGRGMVVERVSRRTRKRSQRGNWLVVSYLNGKIHWCKWIQTWTGVQASRRNAEKDLQEYERAFKKKWSVIVLDIERMVDFSVTEGADQISDLERLFKKD
jgi:hypothetical protein